MSLIYLAHPIDFADDRDMWNRAANGVRKLLLQTGASAVYTPSRAFTAAPPMHNRIQEINHHALINCDGMMVLLPSDVRTLGVPFEMGVAYAHNIPMVMVRSDYAKDTRTVRHPSALLSWLEDMPIYAAEDIESACTRMVTMVMYRQANPAMGNTIRYPDEDTQ